MDKPTKIRVAIVEDHDMFREGIASMLNEQKEFEVVIQADRGMDFINCIQQSKILPDVCIIDIRMPGLSGYETLAIIKQKWPNMKSLGLSVYKENFCILSMLKNGANGYLTKGEHPKYLYEAIISIHTNGYYHSFLVPKELFEKAKNADLPKFTPKQKNFLKYFCTDLLYKEIADQLGISEKTVDYYHHEISEKLGIDTRAGIILFVMNTGIVFV